MQQTITDAAMERVCQQINALAFDIVDDSHPSAGVEASTGRVGLTFQTAGRKMGLAALAYLRDREPAVYRAIISAGLRYTREEITTGAGRFRVRRTRSARQFHEWINGPYLMMLHERIRRTLGDVWHTVPDGRVFRTHLVDKTTRYREKTLGSFKRLQHQKETRLQAVLGIAQGLRHNESPVKELSDAQARRLVAQGKTPAELSLRILGHLCRRTPRQMKGDSDPSEKARGSRARASRESESARLGLTGR
jgi:hypothetical protein